MSYSELEKQASKRKKKEYIPIHSELDYWLNIRGW